MVNAITADGAQVMTTVSIIRDGEVIEVEQEEVWPVKSLTQRKTEKLAAIRALTETKLAAGADRKSVV